MNALPAINFDLPPGSFSGFTTVNGRMLPAIVVPPRPIYVTEGRASPQYVELFVIIDDSPRKRLAYWCDVQPHLYVIYQKEVLDANEIILSADFLPPGKWPNP